MFGILSSLLGVVVSYISTLYPTAEYLDNALAFSMILGIALAIVGLIKLAYFLRTYPILDAQEDVVNEQ
jgi:hypothetical protein